MQLLLTQQPLDLRVLHPDAPHWLQENPGPAPSTSGNPNPNKVRIRAIDARENSNDVVLVDSGASACVSGDSPFFTLERRLIKPIPVLLAYRDFSLILTGVGSLKIPTSNGTLHVCNVYHHPNIP
jgi:hypothetical protein